MIQLHTFGPNFGLPDPSPFCLKVETYLKMANIPYTIISDMNNLKKAPKGKLPFIEDKGKLLADSEFILEYLKETYGDTLDQHLTKEQKAQAYLISKSLDEQLYFIMVYFRWICDDTWPKVREAFFGQLPPVIKSIVPAMIRKDVRKTLYGQGTLRHSRDELLQLAGRSFDALSKLIGDHSFVYGDKVSSIDAIVYAFLAESILVELDGDLNQLARQYPVLVDYCYRIRSRYFDA